MWFEDDVLVETTHTVDNKKEHILAIRHGIITEVSILFPTGCNGQVHCAIYHHEQPVFPSTEGMSIKGNKIPVSWGEYYKSYQPPYELKVRAWGVDCTYNHTITVAVAVLPREAVLALAIVDAIKNLFSLNTVKRIFTGNSEEE